MVGDLQHPVRVVGPAQTHQRLAYPGMQPRPAGPAQLLVDRLPDQRVGEAVPPRRPFVLDDQPGQHGRLHRVQRALLLKLCHRLDQVQVEPAAGDRADQQDGVGLLRQPAQPAPQHVPHPDRDRPPCGRGDIPGQLALAAQ